MQKNTPEEQMSGSDDQPSSVLTPPVTTFPHKQISGSDQPSSVLNPPVTAFSQEQMSGSDQPSSILIPPVTTSPHEQKSSSDQPSSVPIPPVTDLPKGFKEVQGRVITQECDDLISTLPKEESWVVLYLYQGYWSGLVSLQGTLTLQKNFQARETDIILASYPKSGTTWLKALNYALINRSTIFHQVSPETYIDKDHPFFTKNPHVLVPFLELHASKLVHIDHVEAPDLFSSLPSPRILATHLPLTLLPDSIIKSGCKVVFICREPKDTFISFWHFFNKKKETPGSWPLEKAFDEFCRGVSLYGPFWDNVLGFHKESLDNPQNFLFLKFEDMKENPTPHVKRLAEFLGCPFSLEEEKNGIVEKVSELCSFEQLSKLEVNKTGNLANGLENKAFFRKGETGDWKNYLTAEMVQRIDQITEEKTHGSGLKLV